MKDLDLSTSEYHADIWHQEYKKRLVLGLHSEADRRKRLKAHRVSILYPRHVKLV